MAMWWGPLLYTNNISRLEQNTVDTFADETNISAVGEQPSESKRLQ